MALKKPDPNVPPAHLSDEARRLWVAIMDEYGIDDPAGRLLLLSACESLDLLRLAEADIREHGVTVAAATGTLRANPACATARDARAQMLAALKGLNLDLEPLRDGPGRPPGR